MTGARSMTSSCTRPRARGGFTLIELLVALGLTAVVSVGLYSLSAVAAQTFQQQQRVSEMQLRLRTAMEQIRSDLQRAGYMGTPASDLDPRVCPRPAAVIQGVELRRSLVPIPLPADNAFIAPVELRLTGNFQSTDEYYIQGINGTTVYLQHRTQEFADRVPDAATMDQIFRGRMVRLTSPDGSMQFGMVTGTTYFPPSNATSFPSLTLSTAPTIVGANAGGGTTAGCGIPAIGTGSTLAPVTTVVYRFDIPSNISAWAGRAYSGNALTQTSRMDLIREEYNVTAGGLVLIPGAQRLVAEFAADFDVAAVIDTAGIGLGEPTLTRLPFGDARNFSTLALTGGGAAAPERARSLVVRLSVRDRVQDPDFGWSARSAASEPLTRYRVFTAQRGAARVRTVTTEMGLPNIAFRNLRLH